MVQAPNKGVNPEKEEEITLRNLKENKKKGQRNLTFFNN
jgi:hypothetical protein